MNIKKRFLLIAPWDYQLYAVIEKNLISLGYDVVVVHNNSYPFTYENISQRTTNFFRKTFLKDRDYKNFLRHNFNQQTRLSLVKTYDHYDVTLVIRADFFPLELLLEARKRSDKFISFHYDGISRNPEVLPKVHLFDRFYAFDKTDVVKYQKYGVQYVPNFYFDYPDDLPDIETKNKIYYISSFHPSRLQAIIDFHKFITEKISPVQFDFVYNLYDEDKVPLYVKENFHCLHKVNPYEDQLVQIKNTEIILDFRIDEHQGLSFRIFDGLKLQKKVITTNATVVDEDFYHPNNFFILTEDNKEDLDDFLTRPYVKIDEKIRSKYSFTNWLATITDYTHGQFQAATKPLISIIIPCYNNERVIIEAIQSAEKQTYKNVEIIVVDDGSTDQTFATVSEYIQGTNKNVKLYTKTNSGPAATRNYGFDQSNGQFIVFLDGDDKLHEEFVEEYFNAFIQHPNVNLVYSNAEYFEGKTGPWHIIDYNKDDLLISNSIPIFAMISAETFEKAGKFDENLPCLEDWELWIRVLAKNKNVYKIDKSLYYYRKRIEKNSLTDNIDFHAKSIIYYHYIYEKHIDLYREMHLDLPRLLDSYRANRQNHHAFLRYKRKYYSVWYRKLFYKLFKPDLYREIFH